MSAIAYVHNTGQQVASFGVADAFRAGAAGRAGLCAVEQASGRHVHRVREAPGLWDIARADGEPVIDAELGSEETMLALEMAM